MTCIVSLIDKNKIWFGCDSFVGDESSHTTLAPEETKIFKLELDVVGGPMEEMLFGVAGAVRSYQVIKYNLELPPYTTRNNNNEMKYLVNQLMPEMRDIHKEHGTAKVDNEVHSSDDTCFLIGWRHRLYYIDDYYAVVPVSNQFLALGSGELPAHGSLQATQGSKLTPKQRLIAALEAAEANTNHVRKPFYIESVTCP
jgi:ATP-dependent protease HslVU (ClpYQ) peptidase subunit